MKRLLLPIIAALVFQIPANALTSEEKRETCALLYAGQITNEDAAKKLGIQKPQYKFLATTTKLSTGLYWYCHFYGGSTK